MNKQLFILLLVIFQNSVCRGEYTVKSNNILNPDLNIDYVKNNVQFWMDHAYDATYGGFYSSIDRTGKILDTNKKSLISQTRQGYGFTRAFMLTGDENYLTYAKSALDFLFAYGWDKTNDGWYCFAKRNGQIDNRVGWNPNAGKWGFQQQYALVGIIANYEATHDVTVKSWMDKGLNSTNYHLWDARPGYEGYFEQANLDWSGLTGKGFTSTVDAITTNAELAYLVTQDPIKKDRLAELANIILKRFIPQMDNSNVKVLYPEGYDNNWTCNTYGSDGSIGHFIKTSWVLGRAFLCDTTKTEIKNAASKILDEVWTYKNDSVSIWDHVNGGPFNSINTATAAWGSNGDNKDYWTLEQGFTGPMINYYITKNPIYLQMADESILFHMSHFIDPLYGETFQELDPTGTIIRNSTKGDDFKANYHAVEFGYYAYLYSNLYYLHQPANLYYKFAPTTSAQSIKLTPIPMEDGLLRIKSVTLDGANFTSFDASTRTLNIAANQGGKFKVTYESLIKNTTAVTKVEENLIKVFPNPTSDQIQIEGLVDINRIEVLDLAGKVLIETNTQNLQTIKIDLQRLRAGIYFVSLHQNTGAKLMKKIVKS